MYYFELFSVIVLKMININQENRIIIKWLLYLYNVFDRKLVDLVH